MKANSNPKYLIVGGVAGGATAAARIRRNTEQAEIILFEKGPYISYANCGLPYYIGGVIEERDRLFVQTPRAFGKRFNMDVRVNSEVTRIEADKKLVHVRTSDGRDIPNLMTSYFFLRVRRRCVLPCRASIAKASLPCVMWPIRTESRIICKRIP